MLESELNPNNSDTITRQSFRLSKKWKKKFEPNIDLMDNHLINHNLINHNLSKISGDSKEDSCSTANAKNLSESIETDLDIRTLEHENNLQHKMQSFKDTFKPQCPDFEPSDCPFSCCVFLCLLAKHSRSKKKKEKRDEKSDKKLKYSTNSIQSNCNTTASTVQEDDPLYRNPTRVSSQTNLNISDNVPEASDDLLDDETIEPSRRFNKNTQV